MFNYDWFHDGGLKRQVADARKRCARRRLAARGGETPPVEADVEQMAKELETRTILYLKDGLSYEMREMADIGTHSALAFECTPVDENYQVGAYVIVVPFEDITRVEVFAVHPEDKPQENLRIPGFRSGGNEPRE